MYDPLLGRFLGDDPLGVAGGDPNLYRYAANAPTNATDPSGYSPVTGTDHAAGGAALGPLDHLGGTHLGGLIPPGFGAGLPPADGAATGALLAEIDQTLTDLALGRIDDLLPFDRPDQQWLSHLILSPPTPIASRPRYTYQAMAADDIGLSVPHDWPGVEIDDSPPGPPPPAGGSWLDGLSRLADRAGQGLAMTAQLQGFAFQGAALNLQSFLGPLRDELPGQHQLGAALALDTVQTLGVGALQTGAAGSQAAASLLAGDVGQAGSQVAAFTAGAVSTSSLIQLPVLKEQAEYAITQAVAHGTPLDRVDLSAAPPGPYQRIQGTLQDIAVQLDPLAGQQGIASGPFVEAVVTTAVPLERLLGVAGRAGTTLDDLRHTAPGRAAPGRPLPGTERLRVSGRFTDWPENTTSATTRANAVTQRYDLPAVADLTPGQHYYITGTGVSDHELMALSEASRREFALLTLEHPDGRTVQMLIPGGRNGESVDIPAVWATPAGLGPNVRVTRVVHTHPPGSVASLDDFDIAARNGYTLEILMREENGSLGLQRILPEESALVVRLWEALHR